MLLVVSGAAVLLATNAWVTATIVGRDAPHRTPAAAGATQTPGSEEFGGRLDRLGGQLDGIRAALDRLVQAAPSAAARSPALRSGPTPDDTAPDLATGVIGNAPAPVGNAHANRPRVAFVNPTPEQNEQFESLNASLEDPDFLANLNLQEFSRSSSLQSLPEPLRQALIQKAIAQYNNGLIDLDAFLGPNAPIYR